MGARRLWNRDGCAAAGPSLPTVWQELLAQLVSPEYCMSLGRLFDRDLTHDLVEVALVRYGVGGFVSAHRDKPQKTVGHVLYFNERWEPDWGGHFCLLNSEQEDDVFARMLPRLGTSVVFERSETSWHLVTPVTGKHDRLAVHVDFWSSDPGDAPGRSSTVRN
jgi:Rps23 Pro-64 3,4-dihydroxylase Tpa1-like proline 4-hydroxylase